jgi:DNA-binding HxlR family transcriptional regulator
MNLEKIFQVTNEEVAEFLCTVYIYHAILSWQWKLIIISELTKGMQHTKLCQ